MRKAAASTATERRLRKSSGDVFRDLGFTPEEAEDLKFRSDLLLELQRRIAALDESQATTAARLQVSQPRVSDLMRGRIDKFSFEMLASFLRRLGAEVRVVVSRR